MAKAKSGRLPKRIGGVKLPKEVRKAAARLIEAASSPAGQELIAAALTMAAGAITAQAKRRRASAAMAPDRAGETTAPAGEVAREPSRDAAASDPHQIGVELGRIAEAALGGFLRGRRP